MAGDATQIDQNPIVNPSEFQPSSPQDEQPPPPLSKNAQKKLLKLQKYEAKKAEKKASIKEQKKREAERKRKEWEETLTGVSEEERLTLIESRRKLRKERMEKRSEERESKIQRLTGAKTNGQKIVIDLEFSHLMTSSEIHSLVQQKQLKKNDLALWWLNMPLLICLNEFADYVLLCGEWKMRFSWSPLVDGLQGEMENQLQRLPGFDKWIIEKECRSYVEALEDQKENLVYLTADAEMELDELDPKKIYIVVG
ncbi:hypothetical protein GH714_015123 [Hevea brasiliensis]|uniref:tRNA (guanine(9)-N(1))-methyltransferase n=1 Tax=Hevea brasiliensis TaxID=3981 RepID=A0A6A6KLM0_HEVBR|nr:hypothetical protein GH714_015123 [Hevea brasiliensis]